MLLCRRLSLMALFRLSPPVLWLPLPHGKNLKSLCHYCFIFFSTNAIHSESFEPLFILGSSLSSEAAVSAGSQAISAGSSAVSSRRSSSLAATASASVAASVSASSAASSCYLIRTKSATSSAGPFAATTTRSNRNSSHMLTRLSSSSSLLNCNDLSGTTAVCSHHRA